jgi:hypothetical protein
MNQRPATSSLLSTVLASAPVFRLRRRVRLGGQQLRVQVGGFPAAVRGPAELGAVRGFALAEQQVIRLALDPLAGSKPRAFAPSPHQRPGDSPPFSLAWM